MRIDLSFDLRFDLSFHTHSPSKDCVKEVFKLFG